VAGKALLISRTYAMKWPDLPEMLACSRCNGVAKAGR
jgi:hypothetical protein